MDATDSPPTKSHHQMFTHPPNPFIQIDEGNKLQLITALVVTGVVALFLLHVLGSVRRASSHKLLHVVVLGAYTLSYTLVSYTLGLMQASAYYFTEFPVWAVCLLMLLGGTDNLMACNLNDVEDWKRFHVKHLFEGGLVIYIVAVYGTFSREAGASVQEYQKPLWGILLVIVLQSCVRIKSMRMASKSNLLSRNVKPIVDHMKDEDEKQPFDPKTMEGYRYVVGGEHRPKDYVKWLKHAYDRIEEPKRSIITVEEIWRCKGSMLHSESERALQLKDVCLSMALSKMLNRRFAGCELHEAALPKNHDFVFGVGGLLEGDNLDKRYERPFRVIGVELGFVYDLYYTRYPYLYRKIRYFALCLPVAMVILCSWLTYKLFKKHSEPDNSKDTSLSTTLFLMAVVTFLEVIQLYLHIASDWFKVALIRSYVTRHEPYASGRSDCFSDAIISLLLRLKRFRPWEDKLGQYSLLQSYNATRGISYCIHYVTLCLVDKAKKGRKRGKLVKLSTEVKKAVIDSLKRSNGHLTMGARSLRNHTQLSWACSASDGSTVTHTILVWHVATTICKQELDAARAKDDKQITALSVEDSNTASSLSQYCAYLIAFVPDLLPDHSFDSASMLDKSIEEARTLLGGAKTMEKRCEILRSNNETNNDDAPMLVIKGARLARQLMLIQDRWKVLSDFWAEMMLYIAPRER